VRGAKARPWYRLREPRSRAVVQPPVSVSVSEQVHEVPPRPDQPGVPLPPIAEDAHDPELESLASVHASGATRALTVVRIVTMVAAAMLVFALRHDLRYALASGTPVVLSSNASTEQLSAAAHKYVSLSGIPGGVGAIDYRRTAPSGLYRLAPLVDRPDVFVELRLPDGVDPSRFVPPTTVQGRLVPLDEGGVRFGDGRELLEGATGHRVPANAFLLESGAQPSFRAPAVVLGAVALLVLAVQAAFLAAGRSRRTG